MYHYQVTVRLGAKSVRETTVASHIPLSNLEISRQVLERIHVSVRYQVRIVDIKLKN